MELICGRLLIWSWFVGDEISSRKFFHWNSASWIWLRRHNTSPLHKLMVRTSEWPLSLLKREVNWNFLDWFWCKTGNRQKRWRAVLGAEPCSFSLHVSFFVKRKVQSRTCRCACCLSLTVFLVCKVVSGRTMSWPKLVLLAQKRCLLSASVYKVR